MLVLLFAGAVAASFSIDAFQKASGAGTAERALAALASISVFQYFAGYVAAYLISAANKSTPASRRDLTIAIAAAAGLLAANILQERLAFAAIATAAVLYLYFSSAADRPMRAAACVLLAIAANGIWGPQIFAILGDEFLRADEGLVKAITQTMRPDIVWRAGAIHAPDGHKIVILDQCSAFHNMTLAILCCVAMTMWKRQEWRRSDIAIALTACALMFALNAARIFAMARGQAEYHYWHDGFGAQAFGVLVTLSIAAACHAGIVWTERRA